MFIEFFLLIYSLLCKMKNNIRRLFILSIFRFSYKYLVVVASSVYKSLILLSICPLLLVFVAFVIVILSFVSFIYTYLFKIL